MKIAVTLADQSFLATKSVGIFNVSMGLARGLANHTAIDELHLLVNEELIQALPDLQGRDNVIWHGMENAVPKKFGRVWWDQVGVVRAIDKIAPDWTLLPKGFPPALFHFSKSKMACYIHDVIWEFYANSPHNPFPKLERYYFPYLCRHGLRNCDLVLTSTNFNRRRMLHHCPTAHVGVVGIGFDAREQRTQIGSGSDIMLYVGEWPHKLSCQAIEWVARWVNAASSKHLVHVIGRLPRNIQLDGEFWVKHGRLETEELERLQRDECKVALYFSAYEGFGMPPVECSMLGVVCLASDIPPHRENLPKELLFSNDSYEDFAAKMDSVYANRVEAPQLVMPTWNEVADRVVREMQQFNGKSVC